MQIMCRDSLSPWTRSPIMLAILLLQALVLGACDDPVSEPDTREPVALLPDGGADAAYQGPAPVHSKVNVFSNDLLLPGYAHFRIPALVSTNAGTLLAFCEMRTGGDMDPKTLVFRRSTDNGETWGPVTLLEEQTLTKVYGNETVVVDEVTGTIHLFYLQVFPASSGNTCNMYYKTSSDDGVTWSERTLMPNVINAAWRPAGPGTGIQLQRGEHRGRLLIPGRYTDGSKGGNYGMYSDDGGETWVAGYKSSSTSGVSENETTCVELVGQHGGESTIYINSRNQASTTVYRRVEAYSEDSGESLTGNFRQNNFIKTERCEGALLRWSATDFGHDRNRILFSCVSWAKEDEGGGAQQRRRHVGIWSTFDETTSWTPVAKRIQDLKGGYSSMARTTDNLIAILFEEGETNYFNEISLVKINEAYLDVPLTGVKWDFEEQAAGETLSEGDKLADTFKGGNGRDITVVGAIHTATGTDLFHQKTCLDFDGTSYLRLSDDDTWTQLDFNENTSFTVEVIVKAAPSEKDQFLVGRPYQSNWPQWLVQLEEDGRVSFRIDDDETLASVSSAVSVADNRWHHIAAVRDRERRKIRIYVDGDLSAEATDEVAGSLANRRDLFVGGTGRGDDKLRGQIDFVRITPQATDRFFE